MPYVDHEDGRLYYEEHGAGEPLVWAHGLTATGEASWNWRGTGSGLAARYRVIAPDLSGHGRSTGAPETIRYDRFAADLVTLLDHLRIERAHFVGHSGGAHALLALGMRYLARARTLTLVGGAHVWDEGVRAQFRAIAANWPAQAGWIDEQRGLHGATHGADHWRVLLDTLRTWADDPAMPPSHPSELAAITCPVLVLHGDRDPIYPLHIAAALYRALPDAELAVLPRVGHGPHGERPDLFVRLLADFHGRHADR